MMHVMQMVVYSVDFKRFHITIKSLQISDSSIIETTKLIIINDKQSLLLCVSLNLNILYV